MYIFETTVTSEHEAQRLASALCRFLEMHGGRRDASVGIATRVTVQGDQRQVTLWSDEALRSFDNFYARSKAPPPSPRRYGRFDDLF